MQLWVGPVIDNCIGLIGKESEIYGATANLCEN